MLVDCSTSTNPAGSIYFGANNPLLPHLFEATQEFTPALWTPLVLYGESGSGKSFVALSIAERWNGQNQDCAPIVTTAADLARLFQHLQLAAEMDAITLRYRTAPLLVVDDVHQLVDRENASSWFARVLDHRTQYGLPTVVTTINMTALRKLSKMLFSRLTGGLPVSLALPDSAVRNKIIQDVVASAGVDSLDPKRVATLTQQTDGMSIIGTQNLVRSALSCESVAVQASPHDSIDIPSQCMAAAAKRFGIRVADLKGASRRKNTVLARSIAMFLIREFTSLSLVETGQRFQNRDHTTVRHAYQKISRLLQSDGHVQDAVRSICTTLNLRFDAQWSVATDKCA